MLGKRPEGLPSSTYVHPLALVESASIGERTRVWGFAHVMKGATIGAECNIGEQVFVESGANIGSGVTVKNGISIWDRVVIEDQVFLGPHMVFTNDLKPRAFIKLGHDALSETLVRKGATIGAGAVIVCGIELGEYSFVAAGAVVTRTVPAFGMVKGNPAKLSGWICKCTQTIIRERARLVCSKCQTDVQVESK